MALSVDRHGFPSQPTQTRCDHEFWLTWPWRSRCSSLPKNRAVLSDREGGKGDPAADERQ